MKTDALTPYIQIEKIANGSSFNDAKLRAKNIGHYSLKPTKKI